MSSNENETAQNRRLPRGLFWLLLALITLAILLSFASLLLPYLVNRTSVVNRVESELSAWAGSAIHINSGVEFSFIPGIQVHLKDVATSNPLVPLSLQARQVDARLSFLDLLLGRIRVNSLTINNGNIIYRLKQQKDADRLAAPLKVPMKATAAQVAINVSAPDLSLVSNSPIGTISIVDSTLIILSNDNDESRFSNVNATLRWPKLQSNLAFSGKAIWHDEPIQLDAAVSAPLLLASGGASLIDLDFRSPPLNFKFSGNASRASMFYADGSIKLFAPSLDRFLRWTQADIDAGDSIGELSIQSKLTTANGKMRFGDLRMSMSGNEATGSLELDPALSPPKLSGTFAFDAVDFASLAHAFSIALTGTTRHDFTFFNQMDIDLRLSAELANAGDMIISDAAGAIHIANGSADFDLGDGTFAGGKIKGGLRLSGADKIKNAELHVTLTDIVQEQIPHLPSEIPTFAVPLSGSLNLQGPFSSLNSLFDTGTGGFSIKADNGTIRNFNLESFVSSVQTGKLFPLPTLYSGLSNLEYCTIEGTISDGVAVIEAGEISIGSKRVILAGAIPVHSRGLALNGVMANSEGTAGDELLPFFLGGTWAEPYVTMMTKPKQ